MAGNYDAIIKLIRAVDPGTDYTVDTLSPQSAFDVVAGVEVGKALMAVADRYDLWIVIRNLSQSTTEIRKQHGDLLKPTDAPFQKEIRLDFPSGLPAAVEGDVIEIFATLKITAGIHVDHSVARSETYLVV
ncbi:hypothetical protein [Phytohabitans houttuyneae]|uniref:Uncharacterized protein n=1 Tax=Phytohabitans houttuyneae TaxID=1076126 RepID=A0A6V8KET6_9ACTN|nr:hypothetical protein [Phytohabitans houttuyneae]GFJ80971.1 hypothetical protein Phou_051510 [Phytohabitans houttuyneae]